jgi:hypothetical protein
MQKQERADRASLSARAWVNLQADGRRVPKRDEAASPPHIVRHIAFFWNDESSPPRLVLFAWEDLRFGGWAGEFKNGNR